ncbi:MAG: 3-hydroxyacyl-CoA dehydrogenase [Bacteroidetes bacterium]|nr:3-hydroxyacyl-CoA dehydrogenase [Bacteroidota bacterium]
MKDGVVVFDFQTQSENIEAYARYTGPVFLNCATTPLLPPNISQAKFFGFCGLPTFLNRPIFEVCAATDSEVINLEDMCVKLRTEFAIVKNQVGLLTPRVIGMIINEAYFAAEEKISSRNDIDLAMKLGTNYPFGPFEWCEKIGVKNVYDLLEAVFRSTGDERYQVSALLKREALG